MSIPKSSQIPSSNLPATFFLRLPIGAGLRAAEQPTRLTIRTLEAVAEAHAELRRGLVLYPARFYWTPASSSFSPGSTVARPGHGVQRSPGAFVVERTHKLLLLLPTPRSREAASFAPAPSRYARPRRYVKP